MGRLSSRWRIGALIILGATILTLVLMHRPPICTCGRIDLWGPVGPTQSQMLADWYSPSHVIHGFLFYGLTWLLWRKGHVGLRFLIALAIECAWEIAENTPMIIDRYREATMALGYSGDSILNSTSDILMMALGFWAASGCSHGSTSCKAGVSQDGSGSSCSSGRYWPWP